MSLFSFMIINSCVPPVASGGGLKQSSIGFKKISELTTDENCRWKIRKWFNNRYAHCQRQIGDSPGEDWSTGCTCCCETWRLDPAMASTSKGRMRCPEHELMFRRNMKDTWGIQERYMRTNDHLCAHVPSGTWAELKRNMTHETTEKREVMFRWQTCTCTDGTWTRNMRRHILIIRLNMNTEHDLVHQETRDHVSFTCAGSKALGPIGNKRPCNIPQNFRLRL